jgi:hypothetical protein
VLLVASATTATAESIKVGIGQVDISPATGTPMAGYYSTRGSEGIHDPLHAKAIAFERKGSTAILVSVDLISTTPEMVAESRALIEKATRVPGVNVLITATHSHTGPILSTPGSRTDAFGGSSDLAKRYMANLPAQIAKAATQAMATLAPATIETSSCVEDQLAFNRRFEMADGTTGWNPGKMNAKIIKPAGPTDPQVRVVLIRSDDKARRPVAAIVNFAMHLDTVSGMLISADYPYQLSQCLKAVYGDSFLTMFVLGTCGDINHIDVSHDRPQKGFGEAARIGTRLAAATLKANESCMTVRDGRLLVSQEKVELALPAISRTELNAARQTATQIVTGMKPAPKFLDQVHAFKAIDVSERLGKPFSVEVQTIVLGPDLAFVSLPGEIFVELGLAIHKVSPFRSTIIAELANGSVGYVPTKRAYAQGNYEVVSARVAEGSGEKLVESAIRQLKSLKELSSSQSDRQ